MDGVAATTPSNVAAARRSMSPVPVASTRLAHHGIQNLFMICLGVSSWTSYTTRLPTSLSSRPIHSSSASCRW